MSVSNDLTPKNRLDSKIPQAQQTRSHISIVQAQDTYILKYHVGASGHNGAQL